MHFFDRTLSTGFADREIHRYHEAFAGAEASHPGEFTPAYLRYPWLARILTLAGSADTVFICLLRDPVERFFSALHWAQNLERERDALASNPLLAARLLGSETLWGGMYAAQLRPWDALANRPLVLQFEALISDPIATMSAVWSAMGLESRGLPPELVRSRASRPVAAEDDCGVERVPGLGEVLRSIYRPQVPELVERWDIDPALWRSTCR